MLAYRTNTRRVRPVGTDLSLRAKAGDSLTLDEMRQRLPAIFAEGAHESRSDRYVYISTQDMLAELMKRDFVPVEARVSRTKDESRRGFTKHMLRLRSRSDIEAKPYAEGRKVGDTSFEVILRNAHDGTGSYQFMAGLFRLVCLNGMVVSDGELENVKVLHTGNRQRQLDQVVEGAFTVLEQGPKVMETVQRWREISLVPDERMALAEAAHHVRFADAQGEIKTPIKPEQLLHARRHVDTSNDLWTTFNTIQENTLRGGLTAFGRDANNHVRRVSTREVRGIDGDVKLNRALWQLAAKLAEIKTGA